MINSPTSTFYANVVDREIVRIYFLLMTINELDVLVGDTYNIYLSSFTTGKYTTRLLSRENSICCLNPSQFGVDC